jgi:glutathione S-transferase
MSLELHFHPLSSFCQKVMMAFYENDTPFTPRLVDFGDEASRAALLALWPVGKIPVLRDLARDRTIPETSIIIEYLAQHYPGRTPLVPADADLARQTRLRDRFFDLYVNLPMQKIVGDTFRPAGRNDPHGVEDAKKQLATAYGMIDADMATNQWAMGDAFTMADCAAAPALLYANVVAPFAAGHKHLAAYLERLMARPSYARALVEARPYIALFPMADEFRATYSRALAW